MRLIDADQLLSLERLLNSFILKDSKLASYIYEQVIFDIEHMPTVDPVQHGYWFDKGSLSCRCSNCGCKSDKEYHYCPNCGAKMDGDKIDEL